MKKYISRTGAIGALLDEYERSIDELKNMIIAISIPDLIHVVDRETKDENCISIQTILTHVINSGYNYAIAIKRTRDQELPYREKMPRNNIADYEKDLDGVFEFTSEVLQHFTDPEIEESENSRKILTRWDQRYDIEQLMEHAIVHILRHRRQVEKFIIKIRQK